MEKPGVRPEYFYMLHSSQDSPYYESKSISSSVYNR